MLSLYYGLYLVLGEVFRVTEAIIGLLRLDLVARALEAKFGNFIIGLAGLVDQAEVPRARLVLHRNGIPKLGRANTSQVPMRGICMYKVKRKCMETSQFVRCGRVVPLGRLHTHTHNKNGPAKMLHTFYQVRVPLVVEGLAETGRISKADVSKPDSLKGVRILEAGCGGGVLAEDLARLGAYVVGVDPGTEMIELAKRHLETESADLKDYIEYHAITVEQHAEKFAGTYDAIVCSEVMEHVDEKVPILEACVHCLKPGGSLFITTENQTMPAWFMFIIIPEYIAKFIPKGTHFYEKFVSPGQISKILDQYQCKTQRVRGFFYDRMYNSWSFIDSDECNYGLHAVKK